MSANNQKQSDPTRERLLDEAERLFATKEYNAVSVREITSAAGTNLAAVNYHFGSKENLYLDVFQERWHNRSLKIRKPLIELSQRNDFSVREVVETMARAFLKSPFSDEERRVHTQLIVRAIGTQDKALQVLMEKSMKPIMEMIVDLFRRCLPQPVEEERLRLIMLSVFSQILYFNFSRPVVTMITGMDYEPDSLERLIRHLTDFALHGLGVEKS